MTGATVHSAEWPHSCSPQDERSGYPDWGNRTYAPPGTVWQCECGQYWESRRALPSGYASPCEWQRMRTWRARRALKRGMS